MAILKRRLHKFNGASYDTIYFETKADMVLMNNGSTVEDTVNSHRTRHQRNGADPLNVQDLLCLGTNPITTNADDTVANWCALGTGFCFYTDVVGTDAFSRPSTWGFLINIVISQGASDIWQIYKIQTTGVTYFRSGNAGGWGCSWTKYVDSNGARFELGDQCSPPDRTFLVSVDYGIDSSTCNGLSVRCRWGDASSTIFEAARGWNGSGGGYYPALKINGLGQTIVQSGNIDTNLSTAQVRNVTAGTSDPSSLTSGEIYCVYE